MIDIPLPLLKWTISPTLVGILIGPVAAQLVSYEGFGEYSAAVQVESGPNGSNGTGLNGGAGWGGAYDVRDAIKSRLLIENRTSSPVNYTNGEITIVGGNRALRFYDNANGSYALRRPLGTVFSAEAGETLWFSILFRTATGGASPLANEDVFQLGFDDNDNAESGTPRISIGSSNASATFPAPANFFARSTTATDASANVFRTAIPIAAATTYLLVGRIQSNAGIYDSVSLWVNPSASEDPGTASDSITLPSGLSSLSHAFIRTNGLDNMDAYVLDEWRIGRDYGSVVQSLQNALRILPSSSPGGSPTLRWPASLTGVALETSTTLAPGSWTEVPGPFAPTGAESQYSIPIGPGNPRGFYRLRR